MNKMQPMIREQKQKSSTESCRISDGGWLSESQVEFAVVDGGKRQAHNRECVLNTPIQLSLVLKHCLSVSFS